MRYEPLTPAELTVLVEQLDQRFPLATDFGPRERVERPGRGPTLLHTLMKEVYAPATEKAIEEYREKHKKWRKQCEDRLRGLNHALQARDGPPVFIFSASNDGTRPASVALVTFRAKGQFEIMRRPHDDDGKSNNRVAKALALSNPPSAPRGSWTSVPDSLSGVLEAFQRIQSGLRPATFDHPVHDNLLRDFRLPQPHDPNKFYFKPDRPSLRGEQFSLECQQWRHGIEPEQFVGQIHFDEEAEGISGAIECRIHAENLSQSATKTVPIQIRVRRVRTLEIAAEMVRRLFG